jgi:hypothetical protein
MKGIDEYIACGINVLFGLVVGLLIFIFGCGSMKLLYDWRGFLLCTLGGAAVGLFSYTHRHHELSSFPNSPGDGAFLLLHVRRVTIIAIAAAVAVYFMWE